MTKRYKPGQKAPKSGQYEIVGPRGGQTGIERTITKGEPMPPTRSPGQMYKLSDATKHR
ncbi:YjzC family protein [uncultured Pseudoteredinibacter sp.]|uniref:YjzC family protein n=1 Tax=uncultured Pseudoteredinibacter sp. TaxID=1641701 RepID=UPI003423B926